MKVFLEQHRKKAKERVPMLRSDMKYVTPKEYAAFVNMHTVTVYGLLAAGRLEGAIKIGRKWKIPILPAK